MRKTTGIRELCHKKCILYTSCRENNDTSLKLQYKRYSRLLTNVTQTGKKKSIMTN